MHAVCRWLQFGWGKPFVRFGTAIVTEQSDGAGAVRLVLVADSDRCGAEKGHINVALACMCWLPLAGHNNGHWTRTVNSSQISDERQPGEKWAQRWPRSSQHVRSSIGISLTELAQPGARGHLAKLGTAGCRQTYHQCVPTSKLSPFSRVCPLSVLTNLTLEFVRSSQVD